MSIRVRVRSHLRGAQQVDHGPGRSAGEVGRALSGVAARAVVAVAELAQGGLRMVMRRRRSRGIVGIVGCPKQARCQETIIGLHMQRIVGELLTILRHFCMSIARFNDVHIMVGVRELHNLSPHNLSPIT